MRETGEPLGVGDPEQGREHSETYRSSWRAKRDLLNEGSSAHSDEAPPKLDFPQNLPEATHLNHFERTHRGIADAPHEGLWDYLDGQRQRGAGQVRFEFTQQQATGICQKWWVTDRGCIPPETWMLKQGYERNTLPRWVSRPLRRLPLQDTLNEQVAARLVEEAGFPMPNTKWASAPDARQSWMAQRHFQEQFVPDGKLQENDDHLEPANNGALKLTELAIDQIRASEDPKAVARVVVFDYLINNKIDRHLDNFVLAESADHRTLRFGMIDHGLAFGAQNNAMPEPGEKFEDWHADYRADSVGKNGGWNASDAAARIAGSPETLRDHLQAAVSGFARVDTNHVLADVRDSGASREQVRLVKAWLDEFDWRRQHLSENVDEVVGIMVRTAARA